MDALTDRQRECLDFIKAHIKQNGFPPTRAELAKAIGVTSTNTADFHLQALARKGYIELPKIRNRNIILSEPV